GHAALEGDRLVLGAPGRLAARGRGASFAVLDDVRRPLERAHLADPGDVAPVPLDAEREALIGVEWVGGGAELRDGLPAAAARTRFCMKAPTFSRICAQSGSSFGSKTTHCVPR